MPPTGMMHGIVEANRARPANVALPGNLVEEPAFRLLIKPDHDQMSYIKLLAVLPFLGILVGTPFFNRVEPIILGMPLILAWIVLWIILTGGIMAIIYLTDPANRQGPEIR